MTVRKTPGGRFRAQLKSGREFITSRTFDTKREAVAWLKRERAALDGGIDPRAGKERTAKVLERWLAVRERTVAVKTFRADKDLVRLMPTSMQNLHLSAITGREVARSFESLLSAAPPRSPGAKGRAPKPLEYTSVVRYRASLSTFFAWCVREKLIEELAGADRDEPVHRGRARTALRAVGGPRPGAGERAAGAGVDGTSVG